jgi:hypothetical protein
MLLSRLPLLEKNCLGLILLYAQPAAPKIVVLPPPFGPISAVTGKSNLIIWFSKPLTLASIILFRYLP